jgi:hypothetical protein
MLCTIHYVLTTLATQFQRSDEGGGDQYKDYTAAHARAATQAAHGNGPFAKTDGAGSRGALRGGGVETVKGREDAMINGRRISFTRRQFYLDIDGHCYRRWFTQLVAAMLFLHQKKIIHR